MVIQSHIDPAIHAQTQASFATLDFLRQLQNTDGSMKNISFGYGSGDSATVINLPLLAFLPGIEYCTHEREIYAFVVPFLQIDTMDVKFNVKIHSLRSKSQTGGLVSPIEFRM
jgi:hypothetical protein